MKGKGEKMKKFENLPVDVQETIKGYLKAFNKVDVYYENGDWVIDKDMPILKENWEYINKHIYVGED